MLFLLGSVTGCYSPATHYILHPYATSLLPIPLHAIQIWLLSNIQQVCMYIWDHTLPTTWRGSCITVCFRMCSHLGQIRKLLDTGKCMQRCLKVEGLASSLWSCQMPRLDQYQARPLWIAPASLKGSELEWTNQKLITSQVISGRYHTYKCWTYSDVAKPGPTRAWARASASRKQLNIVLS